ncbi:MAG: hypothetical protein J6V71_03265 [Clostridia bacterium]|nr:hypothetical protein [Clostridia bacterium]
MQSYLIIGDANSMHIYNYVKNILGVDNYKISLMTLSTKRVREEYRQFYQENDIKLYSIAEKYGDNIPNKTKKERIINFIRKYLLAKSLPKFDFCHIHSVYKTSLFFYLSNRRKFKHLITSFWGGDIEDKSKRLIKIREKCFKRANAITVTTQKTLEEFRDIYGNKFNDKLKVCRFATAGVECIKKVYEENFVDDCKEIVGFPKDKFCITCGYSAYADQHQDVIINKIATLPQEIKNKIFISVPMQYGKFEEDYVNSIYNALQNCGCEYTVLTEYFPFEKKAAEAIATDLYIHMRDTDAFSNSLKEQICAGTTVIVGKWLKYYELEQMNADFTYVDSFDKIPDIVLNCLENKKEKRLFQPIYDMYSFVAVKNQWKEVFDFMVGENSK